MPDDANAGQNTETVQRGAYQIWTANRLGLIDPPANPDVPEKPANPHHAFASEIYFGLRNNRSSASAVQVDLVMDISKVLRAVQKLYYVENDTNVERAARFRSYYVRLFHLAQVGLEVQNPSPDAARQVLAHITTDLIDDEAGKAKNGNLTKLGLWVLIYCIPVLILYVVLCAVPAPTVFATLHIDPLMGASFCMLWIGCFAGVWLSYGIRKSRLTLADLLNADDDRLAPHFRLLFAGLLTLLVGLLITLGVVDVKLGSMSLSSIQTSPSLALLLGMLCGIGELVLPSSIGSRATTLVNTIK